MKNAIKKNILLFPCIGLLASCSFSLSSRSIATGSVILNEYLANINETSVQIGDGASLNININETVESNKNKGKTTLATYTCTAVYSVIETGYEVNYVYDNGEGTKQFSVLFENDAFSYVDESGTRNAQPSDPMYLINSFNYFIDNYICKAIGSLFKSYFDAVSDGASSPDKASILTGCSVTSPDNSEWDFKIFSEYNKNKNAELGFNDAEYQKLFMYSNIEVKPAYSIEMMLLDGKMTKVAANYSYDLDGYEKPVEGDVKIRISYGK